MLIGNGGHDVTHVILESPNYKSVGIRDVIPEIPSGIMSFQIPVQ